MPLVLDPVLDDIDNDEGDEFAHIVNKEGLTEAYVLGTPVIALCGKEWIPCRDPERLPVCETCAEIYASITGRPGRHGRAG